MTDQEFQTAVAEAKKNGDTAKLRDLVTEYLRPEAKEVVENAMKSLSTKNGYAIVMNFALGMPKGYRPMFLEACRREGYPVDTISELKQMVIAQN